MDTQTNTLTFERDFAHPPDKVWRALTQGPLLEDWLMRNDFEPVVGRKFQFRSEPMPQWDGIVDGEVLEADPPRRLTYTWGSAAGPPVGDLRTTVTWTLTPAAGGTRLVMEQSGFPDQGRNYQGAQYGWTAMLGKLDQVIDKLD